MVRERERESLGCLGQCGQRDGDVTAVNGCSGSREYVLINYNQLTSI